MIRPVKLRMTAVHNVLAMYAMGAAFATHFFNKPAVNMEAIRNSFHARRRFLVREDMDQINQRMNCGTWVNVATEGVIELMFAKNPFIAPEDYSLKVLCCDGSYTLSVLLGGEEVVYTVTAGVGSGVGVKYPRINEAVALAVGQAVATLSAYHVAMGVAEGDAEIFGGVACFNVLDDLAVRVIRSFQEAPEVKLTQLRKIEANASA